MLAATVPAYDIASLKSAAEALEHLSDAFRFELILAVNRPCDHRLEKFARLGEVARSDQRLCGRSGCDGYPTIIAKGVEELDRPSAVRNGAAEMASRCVDSPTVADGIGQTPQISRLPDSPDRGSSLAQQLTCSLSCALVIG